MPEIPSLLTGSPASVLVIDLYDGAYGPTLRLDVQDGAALERLHSVFLTLARREHVEITMEEGPELELSGLRRIRLRVEDERRSGSKDLERAETGGGAEFVWTLDTHGWERKAGMIEGLLRDGHAGHQYLTTEGMDDALVELAFLEGPRAS